MKRSIDWPILALVLLTSILAAPAAFAQQPAAPDVWAPFRFFVGSWRGGGEGTPGTGTGEETFAFILRGTYLQVRNKAVFDPQDDLAPPGQEFTCYSKGVMKRQKGEPR